MTKQLALSPSQDATAEGSPGLWQNSGSPVIRGVASLQIEGPELPVTTKPQPGFRAPFRCHIPSGEAVRGDQVSREDSEG